MARPPLDRTGKRNGNSRNTKITSWSIDVNFKLTVDQVSKILVGDGSKVFTSNKLKKHISMVYLGNQHTFLRPHVNASEQVRLYVGLFHGPETLRLNHTNDAIVYKGTVSWEKEIEFDIKVEDIPQDCRLCFALHIKQNKVCSRH